MGLFLLILMLAGGTYYVVRPGLDGTDDGGGDEYADLSFSALLDLIFSQKDIIERWAKEQGGDFKEMRAEIEKIYKSGTTEDRLETSLLAYAEARNVKGTMVSTTSPDGKTESTVHGWKRSTNPALSKTSSNLLLEASARFEDKAASGVTDKGQLTYYEVMMAKEKKAMDKAASEPASADEENPPIENPEKKVTMAELTAALSKFESTNVATSCLNTNGDFVSAMKQMWEILDPKDLAGVSVELYAHALDVGYNPALSSWMKPSLCTTVWDEPSSDALMALADLFSNRAVDKAPDADAADIVTMIMEDRKLVDAAAKAIIMSPGSPTYSNPLPAYSGSAEGAPWALAESPAESPFTSDIGDRFDPGPMTEVWS